jgi:NitT/TauT family transport system permease protein/sulfonate transport system permease protein
MAQLTVDPAFLQNALLSVARVAVALIVAMILGTALALLPFYRPAIGHVVHRVIVPFFNSFPSLGWVLLATIWFSVSEFTVLFIQVAILLPFCLINVAEGVRVLDPDTLEMGNSFTRRRVRVFFRIILPLLLPYLIGAMRISYGVAWKIALLAELFGARNGVGYVMLQAQVVADSVTVLSTCLYIVVLFILGDWLVIRPLARRYGEART